MVRVLQILSNVGALQVMRRVMMRPVTLMVWTLLVP